MNPQANYQTNWTPKGLQITTKSGVLVAVVRTVLDVPRAIAAFEAERAMVREFKKLLSA